MIGCLPPIAAFSNLPQPTGICTAGNRRGNKQLAFSQTKLQGYSEVHFTKCWYYFLHYWYCATTGPCNILTKITQAFLTQFLSSPLLLRLFVVLWLLPSSLTFFLADPQSCWQFSIGQSEDAGAIIFNVPQRRECDILLERTINETSFKLPVHICLRFTVWCICHFESVWFNSISVPGHPTILCAFSVTVAYRVQPTDSSANVGV